MQQRIDLITVENSDLKTENLSLQARITTLDASILQLNLKIENLTIELSNTGDARNVAKNDNEELHDKILALEEELYE
jgi:chromosome segregation ATPase